MQLLIVSIKYTENEQSLLGSHALVSGREGWNWSGLLYEN